MQYVTITVAYTAPDGELTAGRQHIFRESTKKYVTGEGFDGDEEETSARSLCGIITWLDDGGGWAMPWREVCKTTEKIEPGCCKTCLRLLWKKNVK